MTQFSCFYFCSEPRCVNVLGAKLLWKKHRTQIPAEVEIFSHIRKLGSCVRPPLMGTSPLEIWEMHEVERLFYRPMIMGETL